MARNEVEIRTKLKDNALKGYKRMSSALKGQNKQIEQSMKKVEFSSKKAFSQARSSILSAKTALIGFAGFLGGVVVNSFIKAERSLLKINNALTVATGSTKNAAIEFQFVKEESARLGLKLDSTAESYAKFAAATKGTSLEGEQARKIFTAVSEASTALGLSADDAKGALNALQQMVSKGNVQAEELRGQLGERIPGAFQMAAKAMGKTTKELNKMLDMGQIAAVDMLPKLAAEMTKTFGPQAAKGAEQLNGKINALGTGIFLLKEKILDAGFRNVLIKGFENASKVVKIFGDNLDDVIANLRIILGIAKVFFVVWAVPKILAITAALVSMGVKLIAMNPALAAITAAFVAIDVILTRINNQTDKIGQAKWMQDPVQIARVLELRKQYDALNESLKTGQASGLASGLAIEKINKELAKMGVSKFGSGAGRTVEDLERILAAQKKIIKANKLITKKPPKLPPIPDVKNIGGIELVKGVGEFGPGTAETERAMDAARSLQDQLRVQTLSGQDQELAQLELFEKEKKAILGKGHENTELLDAVVNERREAINEKFRQKDIENTKQAELKKKMIRIASFNSQLGIAKQLTGLGETILGASKASFLAQQSLGASEVVINTMRGIAQATAEPFGVGLPRIPLIKASGAIGLTTILAQTLKGFQFGGAVGNSDTVPALLTPGEVVVTGNQQRQFLGALRNNETGGGSGIGTVNITVNGLSDGGDIADTIQERLENLSLANSELESLQV